MTNVEAKPCPPCRSGTSQRLTIGAIVGISFGGLVFLALFVVVGVYVAAYQMLL